MAILIPDNVDEFKTEGEERFYGFIRKVAKPDEHYVAWYLPDVSGKEPDFILYSRQAGLIVFEVKDWALNQIVEADPHQVILDMGGKTEARKNPLFQARDYQASLLSKIKEDGHLVSKNAEYYGKPKVPVKYGVVFPNINSYEYTEKGLDKVIDTDRVFFWDDLHPQSDICSDPTGRCFAERLKTMFPPHFGFTITANEYSHLRQLLFPSIRIELPDRSHRSDYDGQVQRLRMLDHHQEAIARRIDGGHRILIGPSGSGKTLVLVHRAIFLKQYNPAVRKILFVCYNITLVNYIKRLFSNKNISLGDNGVDVLHFFDLCSRILGQPVIHENETPDYYEIVIAEALSRVAEYPNRYDAILVDEGQDFSDDMYRVVLGLLSKKTDHFTVALDENQNLYQPKQSWKNIGIKARGRVHRMLAVYRNTSEILRVAERFRDNPSGEGQRPVAQDELLPSFFECHGPPPEIKKFEKYDGVVNYVADKIKHLIQEEGYPPSEIAILYTVRTAKVPERFQLPDAFAKSLEAHGIMSVWTSQDYRAKKSYDITTNSVTISTIHSVKGLDFACVFLVGLDLLELGEFWSEEQVRSLTYVGLTRARYQLFIPWVAMTLLIERLVSSWNEK